MTDSMADPIGELTEVFVNEASKVKAPDGYRDELGEPVQAVRRGLSVANALEATLTEVVEGVRAGRYSRDQGERLQRTAVDDAEAKTRDLFTTEVAAVNLMDRRLAGRLFPDKAPDGIAERWAEVQGRFDGVGNDATDLTNEFVTLVRDAVADGDKKLAGALMSTRGRDELRKRLGRKVADEQWGSLRSAAMDEATSVAQGSSFGAGLSARAQVPQVQAAFMVGMHLTDMKLKETKRRADEAMRQVR